MFDVARWMPDKRMPDTEQKDAGCPTKGYRTHNMNLLDFHMDDSPSILNYHSLFL